MSVRWDDYPVQQCSSDCSNSIAAKDSIIFNTNEGFDVAWRRRAALNRAAFEKHWARTNPLFRCETPVKRKKNTRNRTRWEIVKLQDHNSCPRALLRAVSGMSAVSLSCRCVEKGEVPWGFWSLWTIFWFRPSRMFVSFYLKIRTWWKWKVFPKKLTFTVPEATVVCMGGHLFILVIHLVGQLAN